ncbi:FeoB-associated Cys-rich membrane protein [Sporofaciens sp. SGI.106]|uniref:FeoB-associated Cys-rich membrane protein n=1 Tax=Sporofaciens sp. SGI.106 TaxID=3420568 RepID=UPI003D084EE1
MLLTAGSGVVSTILVVALVLGAIFLAARSIYRKKKNGGCGCGCSSCSQDCPSRRLDGK